MSQSSVTCWLKGKNSPDIEMVARICDVLDISVVDLFGMDHIEQYSELEKLIIKQYRANPQMQSAVDRLLGIGETKVEKLPDRPTIKMSAAAHGGASTSQELTPEEYENWIKIRDGEMPE